jgi:hypothetical protein
MNYFLSKEETASVFSIKSGFSDQVAYLLKGH